jgi:hypothetical protein
VFATLISYFTYSFLSEEEGTSGGSKIVINIVEGYVNFYMNVLNCVLKIEYNNVCIYHFHLFIQCIILVTTHCPTFHI